MNRRKFPISLKSIPILLVLCMVFGTGSVTTAYADTSSGPESCGQLLADAESQFLSTLALDGSVPATPEAKAAAQEYIRVSKLCYEEIESQNSAGALHSDTPTFIDEGGVILNNESYGEFVTTGHKWGSNTQGTPGGTVSYSFMGNGIDFNGEGYGSSVAISSLPGFQACFITEIRNAFAAWQAAANIQFVEVTDSGSAFNAPGAKGDIRIGAHYFDGASGTLAHAYYPPPNGNSAAGDMHFDSSENWTCNSSGIDIGVVTLHEIGHSLGLGHENTSTTAVMDPYYNPGLAGLQSDDVNGVTAIYGPAALSDPPTNDNIASAKAVGSVPYVDILDTTGAADVGDGPSGQVSCGGGLINKGTKNVWYTYTPGSTRYVAFDTLGSLPAPGSLYYDTYIAVWTGPNINSLSLVGCNDDTGSSLQSQLVLRLTGGSPYYIEVAQYNGYSPSTTETAVGGTLHFHATTFGDVAGNYWAWRWIEGLAAAGVTSGCSTDPNRYCPGNPVSRAQMAIFLLKAKYGSSYVPPVATGVFEDVPASHWTAPWIEQLFDEGITAGCSTTPSKYCPDSSVTRAQMAIFLLRAKYGSSYVPPGATGMFEDVPPTSFTAPWIEQLFDEGITAGCSVSPLKYCPTTPVARDQMAIFLDRTFNISPIP